MSPIGPNPAAPYVTKHGHMTAKGRELQAARYFRDHHSTTLFDDRDCTEVLLYRVRHQCKRLGLRLQLTTRQPELIEAKVWGGWLRPHRMYTARVSGPGCCGALHGRDIRTLLVDLLRELRRWA